MMHVSPLDCQNTDNEEGLESLAKTMPEPQACPLTAPLRESKVKITKELPETDLYEIFTISERHRHCCSGVLVVSVSCHFQTCRCSRSVR